MTAVGGCCRHCEEPTGPRKARPDDRLRDEAIHSFPVRRGGLLRFARNDGERVVHHAASALSPSQARTRASGSACWVTSLTTAIESAPAAKISADSSHLMPPIATHGP